MQWLPCRLRLVSAGLDRPTVRRPKHTHIALKMIMMIVHHSGVKKLFIRLTLVYYYLLCFHFVRRNDEHRLKHASTNFISFLLFSRWRCPYYKDRVTQRGFPVIIYK